MAVRGINPDEYVRSIATGYTVFVTVQPLYLDHSAEGIHRPFSYIPITNNIPPANAQPTNTAHPSTPQPVAQKLVTPKPGAFLSVCFIYCEVYFTYMI